MDDPVKKDTAIKHIVPLIPFCISLLVYVRTMLPGVGGYGDTSKFHFIGKVLGLPHPTGFPLYVFINALVARLPLGTLAWRINFLSALLGALTVAVICRISLELTKSPLAAIINSLMLAFSFSFWSVCVIAEVYTLTFFLSCVTIYCLVRWRETLRRRWFYSACLIYAFSFNHPMVIFLIPSILFLILATDRKVLANWKSLSLLALIIAIGASQYLFLPLRSLQNPIYCEGAVHTVKEFLGFVTGSIYKRNFFALSPKQVFTVGIPGYYRILVDQLTVPGVVFSCIGFVIFFFTQRTWAVFFLLLFATTVGLYINGPSAEQPIYYIPATMALIVAMTFSLSSVAQRYRTKRPIVGILVLCALVLILFQIFRRNFPVEDLSRHTGDEIASEQMLASVKTDSILLSPNYHWTQVLLYKILGEEKRRNDHVYVLHHWEPSKLSDYEKGTVQNWDPCCPESPLPGRLNIYLMDTERESRRLRQCRAMGWRPIPVYQQEAPLVLRMLSLDENKMLLACVVDEGTSILGDVAFDVVKALGFRGEKPFAARFGWASAYAVVRHEGEWKGLQHFRYSPIIIEGHKGDPVPKNSFVYPADIEIVAAGYGQGFRNEISVSGKQVSHYDHGLNLVVVDRRSGAVEENVNVPPAMIDSLRSFYLYELVPEGKKQD